MLKPFTRAEVEFDEIREIGAEGRNSRTFLAKDRQLDAEIVIKRIPKSKLNNPGVYFDEARALYTTSHQNVVQIHYACQDADNVFIAMPFYSKGSVKGVMVNRFLTVREIVRLGCQTLSGLHNIHSKGLIHFDIKPDNILLSDRGEALLTDFGLAKQMYLGLADQPYLYLRMAPPEVPGGGPYDLRFDLYQFGLTLYRMCCGNDVFDAQFSKFLNAGGLDKQSFASALVTETFPNRKDFPAHIPKKLRYVIVKCLKNDPNDRFPSALAIANALADIDTCLDWIFSVFPDKLEWLREESGTVKRFSVFSDGSTEFVSEKDGKSRRTLAFCKSKMTPTEVHRVLRTA